MYMLLLLICTLWLWVLFQFVKLKVTDTYWLLWMIFQDAHGFISLKLNLTLKSLIQIFFVMVETQFNTKIKCIRSDNGPKLYMKYFFTKNGILHQLTCVETPQQNDIVEGRHQHILNVARALKFQSFLPLQQFGVTAFWLLFIL